MAGHHRTAAPRAKQNTTEIKVRMPPALKDHLTDAALTHHRSLNEEIVEHLMQPRIRKVTHEQWAALLALEPKPGDTRTAYEIALQMAEIMGEPLPVESVDDELEEVQIDWLPGTKGELYEGDHHHANPT